MPKKIFFVYYTGTTATKSVILDISEDKKRAVEVAERFAIDNKPLRCQLIELAVTSIEEFPKKGKANG